MADGGNRNGRVKNSRPHDLSTVGYGHFGLPTYHHATTQQWTFPRGTSPAPSFKRIHQRAHHSSSTLTSASEVIAKRAYAEEDAEAEAEAGHRHHFKPKQVLSRIPELIPASAHIKHLEREGLYQSPTTTSPAPRANQVIFGRAPSNSSFLSNSSPQPTLFLATVSSRTKNQIFIWPVQVESLTTLEMEPGDYDEDDDNDNKVTVPRKIPVLSHANSNANANAAPLNEPILQLCHPPTAPMIAYRQSSASTLCLVFDEDHSKSKSGLSMKQVLSLPLSRTGNHPHADIALFCSTASSTSTPPSTMSLQMAVVDVHGNYSVWEITGKRSLSTRLLYQARLHFSGKLWSWSESQPVPRGISPYFDGWHKICFLQVRDSQGSPLTIVANRQKAILCDYEGNECQNIDLRLDSNVEWLLDVWPSRADPSKCILLTSSKVLLLQAQLVQAETKIIGSEERSLRLLCSAYHFLSDGRPGPCLLRMSVLELRNYLLVFLYSEKIPMVTVLTFCLQEESSGWTVNDPASFFPFRGTSAAALSPISEIACLPVHGPEKSSSSSSNTPPSLQVMVMMVARHLDGHITETLLIPLGLPTSAIIEPGNSLLIAPWPEARRKPFLSDRIIDEEDDYDEFIVEDDAHQLSETAYNLYLANKAKARQKIPGKDWSWIYDEVDDSEKRTTLNSALDQVLTHLQSESSTSALLHEIVPAFQVDDIEETEKSLMDWTQAASTVRSLYTDSDSESFSQVYEKILGRFVRTLSENVAPRLRVNTERLSRLVAMDLTLASLIVDQPVATPTPTTPTTTAAITRLGKYTSFAQQPEPEPEQGLITPSAMETILAHLPEDITTNPSDYSYSSIELDLAHKRLQAQEMADPARRRRAERMEAIRRQREEKALASGKTTLSQEMPILVRGSSPPPSSQGRNQAGLGMQSQPERGDFGTRKKTSKKAQSQRAGF